MNDTSMNNGYGDSTCWCCAPHVNHCLTAIPDGLTPEAFQKECARWSRWWTKCVAAVNNGLAERQLHNVVPVDLHSEGIRALRDRTMRRAMVQCAREALLAAKVRQLEEDKRRIREQLPQIGSTLSASIVRTNEVLNKQREADRGVAALCEELRETVRHPYDPTQTRLSPSWCPKHGTKRRRTGSF